LAHGKKIETMEGPQNRRFYGKMRNTLGEHIDNRGNIMKTHREQRKKEKRKSLPTLPNPKLRRKKNQGTLSACRALPVAE
jgi:hypothetical protein